MKDDEFSRTLGESVPPVPATGGWLDGARAKRRRRQGLVAGLASAVAVGLVAPFALTMADSGIDAVPTDASPTSSATAPPPTESASPSPDASATGTDLCRVDDVLEPVTGFPEPGPATTLVCIGTLTKQTPTGVQLEVPGLSMSSQAMFWSERSEGEWSREDSSLFFQFETGELLELWQISRDDGALAYVWKMLDDERVWVPDQHTADELGAHLGKQFTQPTETDSCDDHQAAGPGASVSLDDNFIEGSVCTGGDIMTLEPLAEVEIPADLVKRIAAEARVASERNSDLLSGGIATTLLLRTEQGEQFVLELAEYRPGAMAFFWYDGTREDANQMVWLVSPELAAELAPLLGSHAPVPDSWVPQVEACHLLFEFHPAPATFRDTIDQGVACDDQGPGEEAYMREASLPAELVKAIVEEAGSKSVPDPFGAVTYQGDGIVLRTDDGSPLVLRQLAEVEGNPYSWMDGTQPRLWHPSAAVRAQLSEYFGK
ncbi:hypothetical protein LKO27_00605 [Tessaracoccus sp. OS52]|uniref:hypothetical protein n=1 Tax=Tessaracoccus sp. OS52 TaxID=2886691 RepID=UPI001D121582|nr:hypothetical protein [Tessaracoccus sp. OS52]MCC2591931.1 hypothetical protein [Tessaracoccus sp. OS52]